jgi:hypothetical protein
VVAAARESRNDGGEDDEPGGAGTKTKTKELPDPGSRLLI